MIGLAILVFEKMTIYLYGEIQPQRKLKGAIF